MNDEPVCGGWGIGPAFPADHAPGQPLPSPKGFKGAKHTRANAQGIKRERGRNWRVPKSKFPRIEGMAGLVGTLFGAAPRG
jgi:hypothetical protein